MAKPKKTIPTVFRNVGLPKDLSEKVDKELYSEVESRIPFGALQEFFIKLLQDYFHKKARKEKRAAAEQGKAE